MTKINLKAVYAENNLDWRIVYMPGGSWKLQQFQKLSDSADRRREQPWADHNAGMEYDDAIVLLRSRNLPKKAAA